MEIPNRVNVRLVFKLPNEDGYNKFYWFKMNNGELYWGTPRKTKLHHYTVIPENESIEIPIPENIDEFPSIESKTSYHKSGEIHIKKTFPSGEMSYEGQDQWLLKDEIVKPANILTVISSVINQHKDKIVNPDRNKSYSIRFQVPEDCLEKRFYMECYLCPEGKFDLPKPLLKVEIPEKNLVAMSLSQNIILVIKFAIIDVLTDWHPDIEFSFLPIGFNKPGKQGIAKAGLINLIGHYMRCNVHSSRV